MSKVISFGAETVVASVNNSLTGKIKRAPQGLGIKGAQFICGLG
jgi:hypothetical protein